MGKKALIVDYDIHDLSVLKRILEGAGFAVQTTGHWGSVPELVRHFDPDVIVTDITLPGIGGFEVFRKLNMENSDYQDIPMIMTTAKTDIQDLKRALELGAFDYIKKPVEEVEVLARIQSAIRFKEQKDRYESMVMRDSLTSIYNHALLIELFSMEHAKCEREGQGIAFVMVDIDHFKLINDNYSRQVGDLVLKNVAQIISDTVRRSDIIGRYGGEEFGLVIARSNASDVTGLSERIRENIESQDCIWANQTIYKTVSIGICFKNPYTKMTKEEMISHAHEALSEAKKEGRNRVKARVV